MEITHATKNGILVIKANNERLDAKHAPQFKEEVVNLINSSNEHNVVFDLDNISFIDSSGIGSLLGILRVLNHVGGELKLSGVRPSILTVLELISINKIFEIYQTSDEAVTSFERKKSSGAQDNKSPQGRKP